LLVTTAPAQSPSAPIGRSALLGGVLGIDALGNCLAIAGLIFAGPLAIGLGAGVVLALVASIVSALVLMRFSSLRPALGIAQDTTIALLASAAAGAAALATGDQTAPVMTALAVVGLSTFATAILLIGVGLLRLGPFIGLLPYPVSVGFLASSGWLLCMAALALLVGGAQAVDLPEILMTPAGRWQAGPGVALAVALFLALRVAPGPLTLLVVLGAGLGLFHVILATHGISLDAARAAGMLRPTPATGGSGAITLAAVTTIDWAAVFAVSGLIATIAMINLISVTLNTTSTQMAVGSTASIDREVAATGWANAALGLGGAPAAFLSAGPTVIAHRLGARHPAMTLTYVGVMVIALGLSDQIVPQVPIFLTAGLLLFFGLTMLEDWLWRPMRRLVPADRVIVLSIVALTIWQGILVAVVSGILFAALVFLIGYAQVPPLRDGRLVMPRRSTVDRGPMENAHLAQSWANVRMARLQGFLFFGSVDHVLDLLKPAAQGSALPKHLVLDFGDVTGIDSSACLMLEKLARRAQDNGIQVSFCTMAVPIRARLTLWQPDFFRHHGVAFHDDTEAALEAIEQAILLAVVPEGAQSGLQALFAAAAIEPQDAQAITALLVRQQSAKDHILIQRGSPGADIYIVESGRFDVFILGASGQPRRVRSFTAGSMIGELAHLLSVPRQADVIAHCDSVVMCLPVAALSNLTKVNPALAAELYRLIAVELAAKVVRTNQLVAEARSSQ